MKLVTTLFDGEIDVNENAVTSLVIENQNAFRNFIQSMYDQVNGGDGDLILSEEASVLKMSKIVDLVVSPVPFNLNEKRIVNKISSMLVKEALSENYYEHTMTLLSQIEEYVDSLTGFLPCTLSYPGISIDSLIKMCGIKVENDSWNDIEYIYNYMNLMSDLLGVRLFVFANLRSFFDDESMQLFVENILIHKFLVLLVEGTERPLLNGMTQLIVDNDLCII